jgi:hypothetical protein
MLRFGDGDYGVDDGGEDEVVVADVGTREDARRSMFPRVSASSSMASSGRLPPRAFHVRGSSFRSCRRAGLRG